MYLSLSPIGGQRLSILRSWGWGKGECFWETLQGMEPASLPLLFLQTRRGARNSNLRNSPSRPCLFGLAKGSGAGGDARAEISDLQGLKKAQQGMGNQHRKQEGNKGQALGLWGRRQWFCLGLWESRNISRRTKPLCGALKVWCDFDRWKRSGIEISVLESMKESSRKFKSRHPKSCSEGWRWNGRSRLE